MLLCQIVTGLCGTQRDFSSRRIRLPGLASADVRISLLTWCTVNRRQDVSISDFIDRLSQSGILSSEELNDVSATINMDEDADARRFAQELVEKRMLTDWQTRVLCGSEDGELSIGEYLILEHIGDGGMGRVYKARSRDTGKIVALKLLNPQSAADESAVRRFRREIETASRLKHPNIVATIGSGEEQGHQYLVMEFVDGNDLASLVRNNEQLPVQTAVDCITRAAQGLIYSHAKQVIHRDIKPSNLLLSHSGEIRVLDMGLARIAGEIGPGDQTQTQITKTGSIMGTVDFMAPEQALNPKKADGRADIYSLGCTLYFLLTGEKPYPGETVMEVLVAHREAPIPSLTSVRRDVPGSLEQVFRKMVAKNPADRYQSMEEVVTALQSCLKEHGLAWLMQKVKSGRR